MTPAKVLMEPNFSNMNTRPQRGVFLTILAIYLFEIQCFMIQIYLFFLFRILINNLIFDSFIYVTDFQLKKKQTKT
ncbi:hypothetical protein AO498_15300 [Algoriphagus sanaruensis]|uniref:Uncharacterized protein n=1 Tax=Algoriphagus sanaruensis TaxID=1727163 RepID=A0A142ERR5_9BACT|nr:hypothetical protein AO498_15300 [Algoriphagus sanaruensis]